MCYSEEPAKQTDSKGVASAQGRGILSGFVTKHFVPRLTDEEHKHAYALMVKAQVKFPHVALMALKYLAIAPSERVFSQLKLIAERKRWRMDGGRVERVIFLRCNKNFNV